MKSIIKSTILAVVLCSTVFSCTKSNLDENQNLSIQATEGTTDDPQEEKEDPNA